MSSVKRHPIRGFFAGLLLGLGIALLLVVTSQIALGTLTPLIVVVLGIVAGVLWSLFGPVRGRRDSSPKTAPSAEQPIAPTPPEPTVVPSGPPPPEPTVTAEPEAAPSAPEAATRAGAQDDWGPTHVAPPEGLTTYAGADEGGGANGRLDPGLPVQVVERQGDWVRVVCSNGWAAWVDGSRLLEAP